MKKENWNTENIPDLNGKVMLVTGGNSGLGYESVKAFAQKGAQVIMASRSIEKGEEAKSSIEKEGIEGSITVMELDLMDLSSVKEFSRKIKSEYNRLDVLLNNAGIMTTPFFLTRDGFEAQMGTNHLGHFALTGLLKELLYTTPNSRIVNVSSSAHKAGKMDFDNLLFEHGKDYSPMRSYGRSKLSNLLFTYELQRNFENKGTESIAVAAHPGAARTNLDRFIKGKFWFKLVKPLFYAITQSQDMGALPQIRASVDPNVKGGEYYGPKNALSEIKGYPQIVQSNTASHNLEDAKKLWTVSEKLTGINYN